MNRRAGPLGLLGGSVWIEGSEICDLFRPMELFCRGSCSGGVHDIDWVMGGTRDPLPMERKGATIGSAHLNWVEAFMNFGGSLSGQMSSLGV